MSDYVIKGGDNLWNIAKNQLGLTNNADIAKAVNDIALANGIKDINVINEGASISLPGSIFEQETENVSDSQNMFANTQTQPTASTLQEAPSSDNVFGKYENWQTDHSNAMETSQTYEQYEKKAENIGTEFDFMDGKNINNEAEYKAQSLNLAQGQIDKYSTDNDNALNINEYIDSETQGEINEYVQMAKEGLMTKEEAMDNIATIYAAAKMVFDIVDNEMGGNKDGKLTADELQTYYEYVDSYDNKERKKDGKINIDAASEYPLYLANQVKITDEIITEATGYAASLFED